jgi:ubiquinone/menaquinone biosynthesis C-methylase UbiE
LSKLLLSEHINLYAVEPNADMRTEAEKSLSSYQNFHSIDGTGENTTLASDSVDIITIAEAYHWFDNEQSNCEFKRILKSDGYVVLLWNIFGGNPYDQELSILNKRLCESHKDKKSRATKDERAVHLFGEGNYTKCEFDNTILQPLEGFLG